MELKRRLGLTFLAVSLFIGWRHLPPAASAGARAPELAMPQASLTVPAFRDASVDSAHPAQNYGNSVDLYVGRAAGSLQEIFLQFDLSALPSDAHIVSAEVILASMINLSGAEVAPAAQFNVYAEAARDAWGETSITYQNKPSSTYYDDPPTLVDNSSGGQDTFTVTRIVREWQQGLSNRGIRLRGDGITPGNRAYNAREQGNGPRLAITYTRPTHTPTAGPSPTPTRTPTSGPSPTPTRTATPTPTVTATRPAGVVGECPGQVWSYADRDTWVDSAHVDAIHGGEDRLVLEANAAGAKWVLLHFPLGEALPPEQYIYSAHLELWAFEATNLNTDNEIGVFTLLDGFSESETNWSNMPGLRTVAGIDTVDSSGQTIDVTAAVRMWQAGSDPNHGLVVFPMFDDFFYQYGSREHGISPPKLVILCGEETPTPTPSATPTRTATPSPTPQPSDTPVVPHTDLEPLAIEVTQGVQNLTNSTLLVSGKKTYVRFYARSLDATTTYMADARLLVQSGESTLQLLTPVNSTTGKLPVRFAPDRDMLSHSFLFEIPATFTSGWVSLEAKVDYFNAVPETDESNNSISTVVYFRDVPTLPVLMYDFQYIENNTTYSVSPLHMDMLESWLRRAYPISDLTVDRRTRPASGGFPDCSRVNYLTSLLHRQWDAVEDNFAGGEPLPSGTHVISLVDDGAGFMVGCSPRPGVFASSPAGSGDWGWDFDGSYTDWYGGHELGHSYSLKHVLCRGDEGDGGTVDSNYPSHPDGDISESQPDFTPQTFYGFDVETLDIYPPWWNDFMSYCGSLWIGEYNYEKLFDYIEDHVQVQAQVARAPRGDYLFVAGDILGGRLRHIDSMAMQDVAPSTLPSRGDHSLVLVDSRGRQLASYDFTPQLLDYGPGPPGVAVPAEQPYVFAEAIPLHADTAALEVHGPGGLMQRLEPGPAAPHIDITTPNGGEIIAGDTVHVAWKASDPDGDPLSYTVAFSDDNGRNWRMLAAALTASEAGFPRADLSPTTTGLFRVWASDGIHTSDDVSNGPFAIPNISPQIHILSPQNGQTRLVGQTLDLEAEITDADAAPGAGEQVLWYSNVEGLLGQGNPLSAALSRPGSHMISALYTDIAGELAIDQVRVRVLADAGALAGIPDILTAGPQYMAVGLDRYVTLYVENANHDDAIPWRATASQRWLRLSPANGVTPAEVRVSVDESSLLPGPNTAVIEVVDRNTNASVRIQVTGPSLRYLYLPVIVRPS